MMEKTLRPLRQHKDWQVIRYFASFRIYPEIYGSAVMKKVSADTTASVLQTIQQRRVWRVIRSIASPRINQGIYGLAPEEMALPSTTENDLGIYLPPKGLQAMK